MFSIVIFCNGSEFILSLRQGVLTLLHLACFYWLFFSFQLIRCICFLSSGWISFLVFLYFRSRFLRKPVVLFPGFFSWNQVAPCEQLPSTWKSLYLVWKPEFRLGLAWCSEEKMFDGNSCLPHLLWTIGFTCLVCFYMIIQHSLIIFILEEGRRMGWLVGTIKL